MGSLTRFLLLACLLVKGESFGLGGSVFTFPRLGATDHVTLTPSAPKALYQASICMRFYTDNSYRSPCFFSLATPSHDNAFLLCQMERGFFRFHIGNKLVDFFGFMPKLHEWNSMCVIWDTSSEEHMTQFFINGVSSMRKLIALEEGWELVANQSILLGQDQDTYGGGFEQDNAFTGHLTDVHMWDHGISMAEVQRFMKGKSIKPGNYLGWEDLSYTVHGKSKVERKEQVSEDL